MHNLPSAAESLDVLEANKAARIIGTILKHDNKQTSYKIALLRSINDLAIAYPGLKNAGKNIAIPLRMLARLWAAYYWPFYEGEEPILQGYQYKRKTGLTKDMAFRGELSNFRALCSETLTIGSIPAPGDGFWLVNDLDVARKRATYSPKIIKAYQALLRKMTETIRNQPIRYAGPGEWTVFKKPKPFAELSSECIGLPGVKRQELCVVIDQSLWQGFQELSLYVEALCIHEWSIFTENIYRRDPDRRYERGKIFQLLTERPVYRIPLTWERQRIDKFLSNGTTFICPWSQKVIRHGGDYEIDHILPISVYPINELWNLVPATPEANSAKRAKIPSGATLHKAEEIFVKTYQVYQSLPDTQAALTDDVSKRFLLAGHESYSALSIASAVVQLVDQFGHYRNLARY